MRRQRTLDLTERSDALLSDLLTGEFTVSLANFSQCSEVEQAAIVYRLAYGLRLPPTLAVARHLNLSRDAAAKRVQAARRVGLLGTTSKGRRSA